MYGRGNNVFTLLHLKSFFILKNPAYPNSKPPKRRLY
jgi:hypothetical protein